MNSKTAKNVAKKPRKSAFELFDDKDGADGHQLLEKIQQLETDLSRSEDRRKEQTFYWIAVFVFCTDIFIAKYLNNTPSFLIFVVIEMFALAALAKRFGVDWAVEAIDAALQWFSEHIKHFPK